MTRLYKIDVATREIIIGYIRKYKSYKEWYENERHRLLNSTKSESVGKSSVPSDRVLATVISLDELENNHKTKVIRAIDKAYEEVGNQYTKESAKIFFKRAIWNSCINRKLYNFKYYDNRKIYCSRDMFFSAKRKFIYDIKTNLGL